MIQALIATPPGNRDGLTPPTEGVRPRRTDRLYWPKSTTPRRRGCLCQVSSWIELAHFNRSTPARMPVSTSSHDIESP